MHSQGSAYIASETVACTSTTAASAENSSSEEDMVF